MSGLGLSSGSLPRADAKTLIATLDELGLDSVDLRWGKGHGWEPDGLTPFRDAGVRVAFVGAGIALGRDDPGWAETADRLADVTAGHGPVPIKVFADAALDTGDAGPWSLAARQVDTLAAVSGAAPLVETHHGYAAPGTMARMCDRLGCGVLLDIGGFFRLTGGFGDPDGLVRSYGLAGQVKGFRPADPGTHLVLSELPEPAWTLLAGLAAGAPITIESRSGTLPEDVAVLRSRRPPTER